MSLWPGYELGRYRIEDVLGRGGQATVYVAHEGPTGRRLALKVLSAEFSHDATVRARLEREAEAVRALDHPAIVAVLDTGEVEGNVYISMPLVEGPSLQAEISREGGIEPVRLVRILRQVAAGLDHAHERGMVHRDVKPANVLLDGEDRAYLTDFGLAKVAQAARLTRTGTWVGTIEYIAPEQLMGKPVGPPADVYGLAALAYEALAGRPPFVRQDAAQLIRAHLEEEPRPPSSLRPSLAFVDGVLARGLAKRPEDRFGSAGGMVRALGEALGAD
jgi:serine/threonine protein kinase